MRVCTSSRCWFGSLLALSLGVATLVVRADGGLAPLVGAGPVPPAPWHVVGLPAQRKPFTRFEVVPLGNERVLEIEADRSYGNLVHPLAPLATASLALSWRWRVDEALPAADLRLRGREDMPVRICAMFNLPLSAVPFVERQVLRAVRAGVADDPPAASVCYVWDARLPPGSVLASPFTRRVRYVVVRGPESPLHEWRVEQRDVAADFLNLFGDEARVVPPLVGIAIGADADNTQGHSLARVADVALH